MAWLIAPTAVTVVLLVSALRPLGPTARLLVPPFLSRTLRDKRVAPEARKRLLAKCWAELLIVLLSLNWAFGLVVWNSAHGALVGQPPLMGSLLSLGVFAPTCLALTLLVAHRRKLAGKARRAARHG